VFHFLLVSSIIRKEGFTGELTPDIARWIKIRSLMAPAIWALSIVWVFIEPLSARFVFISIFVIQMFVDRKFRKKSAMRRVQH